MITRQRTRGMTLVEVLLALGLFVMLMMFVFGTTNTVLGMWQAGERRGQGELVFAASTERLRADLLALHTGPRGWFVLDTWEAEPARGEEPAWRLPRMRFLAHGSALPQDDPTGRAAVEIAWLLYPEDALDSRLTKLVRVSMLEDLPGSLRDDDVLLALTANDQGLTLLDGVAFGEFAAEVLGQTRKQHEVASLTASDFPESITFHLERTAGSLREQPAVLDEAVSSTGADITVRGTPPVRVPEFALIGKEWVRLTGNYPKLHLAGRGLRGTRAATHDAEAAIRFPEVRDASFRVAVDGRRVGR